MTTSPRSDRQVIADSEELYAEGWCVCMSSSLPAELLDLAKTATAELEQLRRLHEAATERNAELETALRARVLQFFEEEKRSDRLAAVIEQAKAAIRDRDGDPAGRIERLLRAENILDAADTDAALREHDAEVRAKALEDECAMNDVMRMDELPLFSKVMLNGYTRFAERQLARAAAIRAEGRA